MKTTPRAAVPELVPMRDLLLMLGLKARQTVYNKLRDDPTFPKPRRTGPHSKAWLRSEVIQWVRQLPTAEPDGFDAIEHRSARSAGGGA